MSTAQKVESFSELPTAAVLNADKFVGDYLTQALCSKNLNLTTVLDAATTTDYIFYFADNSDQVHHFLTQVPASAKILIAFPLSLNLDTNKLLSAHSNLRLDTLPPHLYGPHLNLESSGILGQLLAAIRDSQPLTISGDGLTQIYPTFITDVVNGLTKAMFTPGTAGSHFFLLHPEPISVVSFA